MSWSVGNRCTCDLLDDPVHKSSSMQMRFSKCKNLLCIIRIPRVYCMVEVPLALFGSVVASSCYHQRIAALKHVGKGCTVVHMNPLT
jgi:hypothetical protein